MTATRQLDRETDGPIAIITLRVSTADSGPALSTISVFTLDILDVNDHTPKFSQKVYRTSIVEDAAPRLTIYTNVSATDDDAGKDNSFVNLRVDAQHNKLFEFVRFNLTYIGFKGQIDRKTKSSYNVTITATDDGTPPKSSTAHIIIDVNPVNDYSISAMFYVSSNDAVGEEFGAVKSTDLDITAGHTYKLLSDGGGRFGIHAPNGSFYVNASLTGLSQDSTFTLRVKATNVEVPNDFNETTIFVKVTKPAPESTNLSEVCQTSVNLSSAEINLCIASPCQHDGTCVGNSTSFLCVCPPWYTGLLCEAAVPTMRPIPTTNVRSIYSTNAGIDWCLSSPCQHDGTCINLPSSYRCFCALGFEGDNCERNKDECESNPCYHNSTCIDGISMYSCYCKDGFSGSRCDVSVVSVEATREAWNAGTASGAIVAALVTGAFVGFLSAYLFFRYHAIKSIRKSEKEKEQVAMSNSPAYDNQSGYIYAAPTYEYVQSMSSP